MHTKLMELVNAAVDTRAQLAALTRLESLAAELETTARGAAAYAADVEHVEELARQVAANTARERELLDNRLAELERLELDFKQRESRLAGAEAMLGRKRAELTSMTDEVAKGDADLKTFGVAFLRVTADGVAHVPLADVPSMLSAKR